MSAKEVKTKPVLKKRPVKKEVTEVPKPPINVKPTAAIKRAAEAMLEAKAERDRQIKIIAESQEALLAWMDETEQTSLDLPVGKFSRVQSEPLVIDEDKLKKALGAPMWNKITTSKLDKKKLDAFVKSGEIKPVTIASVSEIVPNKPFIKSTVK